MLLASRIGRRRSRARSVAKSNAARARNRTVRLPAGKVRRLNRRIETWKSNLMEEQPSCPAAAPSRAAAGAPMGIKNAIQSAAVRPRRDANGA